MADTNSAKRRRAAVTPASRKRVRSSNSAKGASSGRRSSQKTLTQIDFVQGSWFQPPDRTDQLDFEPIEPVTRPRRLQSSRTRIQKRDTTLTQMDFCLPKEETTCTINDDMLLEAETENAALVPSVPILPQFDRAGPQATDGETTASRPRPSQSNRLDPITRATELESREYHTSHKKRKLKESTGAALPEKKRRSGRIAALLTSRPSPLTAGDSSLSHPTSTAHQQNSTTARCADLPIDHLTEFDDLAPTDVSKLRTLRPPPKTPPRARQSIPSSQTPETLVKPSRRKSLSPREPLSEVPVHVQRPSSKGIKRASSAAEKTQRPTKQKQPRRSKICVLKISSKELLRRTARAEDSQHDLWSVQATSSPRADPNTQRSKHSPIRSSQSPQNDETSRDIDLGVTRGHGEKSRIIAPQVGLQKPKPDVGELVGARPWILTREKSRTSPYGKTKADANDTALELLSPGSIRRPNRRRRDEPPHIDPHTVNMIPEFDSVSDLSEFGSPIANDTQFAASLDARISSPRSSPGSVVRTGSPATKRRISQQISSKRRGLAQSNPTVSPAKVSPLPAPRLVQTSPLTIERRTITSAIPGLPSLSARSPSQSHSNDRVTIIQVPLNDMVQKSTSSSSPLLPPASVASPRWMYPASIPHPSQVSTQAASTQGLFPGSSSHEFVPAQRGAETDRIEIDHSSSVPTQGHHLQDIKTGRRQVPQEVIQLIEDSEFEEELDLDPFSWKAPTQKSSTNTQLADDVTQTPTPKLQGRSSVDRQILSTQASPVITKATTRAERDAQLEVVLLLSSSQAHDAQADSTDPLTPKTSRMDFALKGTPKAAKGKTAVTDVRDFAPEHVQQRRQSPGTSSRSSSPNLYSPSPPRPLRRKYSPIHGFDNNTQSDFTQNGHVTAAYIHRMREEGVLPKSFVPKPFKPKNWNGRSE